MSDQRGLQGPDKAGQRFTTSGPAKPVSAKDLMRNRTSRPSSPDSSSEAATSRSRDTLPGTAASAHSSVKNSAPRPGEAVPSSTKPTPGRQDGAPAAGTATPSTADRRKEAARGSADAALSQGASALDKAGGKGTTDDVRKLLGTSKQEDGTKYNAKQRAGAGASLAYRGTKAYFGQQNNKAIEAAEKAVKFTVSKKGRRALGIALVLLLVFSLALCSPSLTTPKGQPNKDSDKKVAKHFEGKWQEILIDASQTSAENPYQIPWPVLAGIVAEQTDFARFSPYDSVDRDPDRKAEPVGDGGSGSYSSGSYDGKIPSDLSVKRDRQQMANAKAIYDVVMDSPKGSERAAVIALMTAMQESQLENLDYGDRDSVGLFQQRPSQGWGTIAEIRTPSKSTEAFLGIADHTSNPGLYDIPGWQSMKTWAAADAVQRSCCARAYAKWEGDARLMVKQFSSSGDSSDEASSSKKRKTAQKTAATKSIPLASIVVSGLPAADDSCPVKNPSPAIGGKGDQGVGPYLLTKDAAKRAAADGYDPQSPCVSKWVARQLAKTAGDLRSKGLEWERKAPYVPDDKEANAAFRTDVTFWRSTIRESGLFAAKDQETNDCVFPGEGGSNLKGERAHRQYTQQITYSFKCALSAKSQFHTVTQINLEKPSSDVPQDTTELFQPKALYIEEEDRLDASSTVVSEALQFSYAASKWDLSKCDAKSDGRQGLFGLTKDEAEGIDLDAEDRCDSGKTAAAVAKKYAELESIAPEDRKPEAWMPDGVDNYYRAYGGWAAFPLAVGPDDALLFDDAGPTRSKVISKECRAEAGRFATQVAETKDDGFINLIAKYDRPSNAEISQLISAGRVVIAARAAVGQWTPPHLSSSCNGGSDISYAPYIEKAAREIAEPMKAKNKAMHKRAIALATWAGWVSARGGDEPIVGSSSLVGPRLSPKDYRYDNPPMDASDLSQYMRERLGAQDNAPLDQRAVEYAIYFGGIANPFETAGTLTGSLKNSSTGRASEGGGGIGDYVEGKPCKKDNNTVYPNGRIPASALCPLRGAPGDMLRPNAAATFNEMTKAYQKAFGQNICVTDSYRSYEEQVAVKASRGVWAATPGKSNHGWGLALDLGCGINQFGSPQYKWMKQNSKRFGWEHPAWAEPNGSLPEAWHWEYNGKGGRDELLGKM